MIWFFKKGKIFSSISQGDSVHMRRYRGYLGGDGGLPPPLKNSNFLNLLDPRTSLLTWKENVPRTPSPWKNYFLDPRMALRVDLFNDWCSSPSSMQPWVRYDCFLNVNAKYLRVSGADYRVMVVDTLYMWFFFSTSILNVCIFLIQKCFSVNIYKIFFIKFW